MERWSISLALDSRSPVITTLNLAGHSSTPLIEHLNLTRCYCCSQRFSQVLTNQWIVPRSSWDIAFSQLSHACCRQPQSGAPACEQNTSAAREIKRELGGSCALKNLIIPHHVKDTSADFSLFHVMLCSGVILGTIAYISPEICHCYHASFDLV